MRDCGCGVDFAGAQRRQNFWGICQLKICGGECVTVAVVSN